MGDKRKRGPKKALARGSLVAEVNNEFELTPRQRTFADLYLLEPNATKAYLGAGYVAKDPDVAGAAASRLLGNVRVSAYLETRRAAILERYSITAERILLEVARSAFLDPRQAFGSDGKLLAIQDMPEDVARAITSFQVDKEGVGRVRFVDKRGTLELLGKYLRLFSDGDRPLSIQNNVQTNVAISSLSLSPSDAYKRMLTGK